MLSINFTCVDKTTIETSAQNNIKIKTWWLEDLLVLVYQDQGTKSKVSRRSFWISLTTKVRMK